MAKVELVCEKCAFTAFMDSEGVAIVGGWTITDHEDGSKSWCCPACNTDGVCDGDVDTTTSAA